MNFKKIAVVCLAGLVIAAAAPVVSTPAFAARGGVRVSAPKALPSGSKGTVRNNTTNRATNNQTNQQTRQNAQQANARANAQTRTNQSSGWGSAMRNIGLLAGGMFLGSMLSSLFGWGNMGFMADILGVMFNIILLLVIVSLISHLWRKFRGKKNSSDDDAYRRGYEAAMREERFRHKGMTIDVKPIDDDKEDRRR
ncbi:hypothetical protein OCV58_09325 [Megasphaera butyrica]|uniref:hypothetical protein n=1 Tax=Megasphaera butyrica TaxID=2981791 RepID=UPI000822DDFC|nr:hypothetical protein [Megasphaera butyrica]MCU6715103.1 hypothetical protein [Megasphaera butyrica]SCH93086.1 Uncharacterized protein conserved in bacteria [uncultured Megasphaera sp.]SCJ49619.1 Uncharacterized protein conserved in bacteria [uncultured Ruminococcus sp.]